MLQISETAIHGFIAYLRASYRLHGVLFAKVRRKHLEELFLYQILSYFTRRVFLFQKEIDVNCWLKLSLIVVKIIFDNFGLIFYNFCSKNNHELL